MTDEPDMDIVGIGIDMIEVHRIRDAVERTRGFLDKIFDERELRLSERGALRFEELAGRFAVKEAVLKAVKTGWRRGIQFKDIVVMNEKTGAPYVILGGKAKEVADALGVRKIFVSISHTRELAVGIVVLTK